MGASKADGDCSNAGPQISETSVDFLNMDISTKDLVNEAENVHCSCDWTTNLEWGIFEVSTHCQSFLKNRGTRSQRLEKQLEKVKKEQQKLALKVSSAGVSLDSGNAPTAAPPAAEAVKSGTFSAV